jgi:hypothetical protein
MGQCFMMGWEGTEITTQIRTLIEDHHIGAVLLTTKNLKGTCLLLCLSCPYLSSHIFELASMDRWFDGYKIHITRPR